MWFEDIMPFKKFSENKPWVKLIQFTAGFSVHVTYSSELAHPVNGTVPVWVGPLNTWEMTSSISLQLPVGRGGHLYVCLPASWRQCVCRGRGCSSPCRCPCTVSFSSGPATVHKVWSVQLGAGQQSWIPLRNGAIPTMVAHIDVYTEGPAPCGWW